MPSANIVSRATIIEAVRTDALRRRLARGMPGPAGAPDAATVSTLENLASDQAGHTERMLGRDPTARGFAMADTSVPALVLTVHNHNGLNQVRTLGRLGVEVHITHPGGNGAPTRSRYVRGRHRWDVHRADDRDTIRFLLDEVSPAIGRPAVITAGEDRAALFLGEHARALAPAFIAPEPEPGLVRNLVDKRGLAELCERTGTPTPRIAVPASGDALDELAAVFEFPVVVKARHGWQFDGLTDAVTFIAQSPEELATARAALALDGADGVVVQEYIPGGPDSVWIVNGYADARGRTLLAVAGNKLREYPVDRGLTTLGVVRANEEVTELATRFIRQIGYHGAFDLDFRLDARDGRYKLIDFNPRPGASFRLCVDDRGLDAVRAAYLDLTGQPVLAGAPRSGRRWIVENWDVLGARRYLATGRLTGREYRRSLRGVQEGAWAAVDDPAPFALMLAEFGALAARWSARRVARALRLR
jgi:D-aspartate ligase